jgi:AhpD family alkylhydroperoxidase
MNGIAMKHRAVDTAHALSRERELDPIFVSAQTICRYCQIVHDAIADHRLHDNEDSSIK